MLRANIVGTVRDTQGNPVGGLVISAQDPGGELVASAVTDDEGEYVMECLNQDQYNLSLDPVTTGFRGQTVVVSLGPEGLNANWSVSSTAPAVATAKPGAGTCGAGLVIMGIGVGSILGLSFSLDDTTDDGSPVSPIQ